MLRPQLELCLLALSFYTRIPITQTLNYQRLPQATVYLPLIGWVVGCMIALTFILANVLWSQQTAIILALITGIFLTGAFHEDGFADVCDGFGGGYDKARILEIMKDSQIGVYGGLGIVLLFALKISTLSTLATQQLPLVMFSAQSISRLAPLCLMARYPYAREVNSKSVVAVYQPQWQELLLPSLIAVMPCALLPANCWVALLVLWLANTLLGRYFYQHIGGYTGDCLGANQQIAETLFYLTVSALWT